ncbi:ComEA family DNA-binding protein [Tautonia sociabilis]|uniref:Helix-hairpin-helix domain-containing protein n=1 Tax=Tautonia sociabilis TaxID=2080755 RepID=A0A432MPU9_9BACT|nr:helix-hairpin-helix domain-containing protein [Tautonia sociabilis]RUL89279.1 helix-hairpin-helix domain-containing protein [Tautonia sociabilis]
MAAGTPPLWGWGRDQRLLLAATAAIGAVALLVGVASEEPPSSPPPASVEADVNSAPAAVLLALPGLGPTRVDRIVEARSERPFDSLEDLADRVKGIGPATIEGIRPFSRAGDPAGKEPAPDPTP